MIVKSRARILGVATAALLLALAPAAAAPTRVGLFAKVPGPSGPEGIAVAPDGRVFVGTNPIAAFGRDPAPPSEVMSFSADGRLLRRWRIGGQDTSGLYGIYGLALDGRGRVYALDRSPPRVVRIDPRSGRRTTYATFPDHDGGAAPFPNGAAFGPRGDLYVTDGTQALLWRVPAGGGTARLLLADDRLQAAIAGPNGIAVLPGGRALVFAQSNFPAQETAAGREGRVYRVALQAPGRAGTPRLLWSGERDDIPDGLAVGRSGHVYLALAGRNTILEIDASGREVARHPSSAAPGRPVPLDDPASIAFSGRRLLVTNLSLRARDPDHFAVLSVPVPERGAKLFAPRDR